MSENLKRERLFIHGGRIGDLIYALYTVRKIGGGYLILTDHHTPGWGYENFCSLEEFLLEQNFIKGVFWVPGLSEARTSDGLSDHHLTDGVFAKLFENGLSLDDIDVVNLIDAERDEKPLDPSRDFPEWDGVDWPGNIHIAKRYAHWAGVAFSRGRHPWISIPNPWDGLNEKRITFHCPEYRRVRSVESWKNILLELERLGYVITILGDGKTLDYWKNEGLRGEHIVYQSGNISDAFYDIAKSKCLLGGVSSMHALAEGMGIRRYVEAAKGCTNVHPTMFINDLENDEVVNLVIGGKTT